MSITSDLLEVKNIHKEYEGAPLLKGIDFQVASGETFCLLGRSGSGKSTLLRIIAGLEEADEGEVLWNGESMNQMPTWQRNFGLMFQDYALFPHMNVAENVAFGLRMQGKSKTEISEAVSNALELVNMGGFAERSVTDLSGGEQQRIALARALAPKPRLLMLDEPLAALDRALRMELQEELRGLLHKTGIPAIYVTHDQEEALILGDRVAILADGVIEQQGSPEEVYRHPCNRKVAEFLGMTNFVEGKVVSTEPVIVESVHGHFTCHSGQGQQNQIGDRVTLLFRSHGAMIIPEKSHSNCISGLVVESIFRGDDYKVTLQLNGTDRMVFILSEPCEVCQKLSLLLSESSLLCLK